MVQIVWFDAGPERPGRLLLMVHHLVVDAVSLRVLMEDLKAAWQAAADGPPVLDPVPTSFRTWADRLVQEAVRPERAAELALWERMSLPCPPIGAGPADPARDTVASQRSLTIRLSAEETRNLTAAASATYGAGLHEVLLAALALAVAGRGGAGAEPTVAIEVEGHGRSDRIAAGDLSRTVGWFTASFPLRVDLEPLGGAAGADPGEVVSLVMSGLRALPDDGIGYGLLRYLNPETSPILAARPAAQVRFNYLGRLPLPGAEPWAASWEEPVAGSGPEGEMAASYVLDVLAFVLNRPGGAELHVSLRWPEALLGWAEVSAIGAGLSETLTALAGRTRSLITLEPEEFGELEHLLSNP